MFDPDLSQPWYFCMLVFFMFAVIVLRYFFIAGLFHFFFYILPSRRWEHRKVNPRKHSKKQFLREVKWSMTTAIIFALTGALTAVAWQKGYTAFYEKVDQYGWSYLFLSILMLMVVHETYYYWVHRLMHHPVVYRRVHKVHHDSITTSPWTAFSFHPLEGLLESIILPLMLMVIPVHYYALLAYLTIMTFSSVVNHLNVEIYPKGFEKHWLGKWLIGATHHSLHHSEFRYNFGLYFTFWDKWGKTESPKFKTLFMEKSAPLPDKTVDSQVK